MVEDFEFEFKFEVEEVEAKSKVEEIITTFGNMEGELEETGGIETETKLEGEVEVAKLNTGVVVEGEFDWFEFGGGCLVGDVDGGDAEAEKEKGAVVGVFEKENLKGLLADEFSEDDDDEEAGENFKGGNATGVELLME